MNNQTLDSQLLRLIDTQRKWNLFKEQFLNPLQPRIETDDCLVRKGFPKKDATDNDKLAYSSDRLELSLLDVGRTTHLQMIALAYHSAMLDEWSGPSTRINADFDRQHARRTLYSLCVPLKHNTNLGCGNWFSAVTFDTFRGIEQKRIYVSQSQLATWTTNDEDSIPGSDTWNRVFVPLQYYRWIIPDSKVSTWNLALDRNTVYTLGWYQYYLQRMSTHETAISQYATAVRRNETLRNKLALLADQFIKKNMSMRNEFQVDSVSRNRDDRNRTETNDRKVDRFVRALEKLYNDFTKSTTPVVRRAARARNQSVL